MQRFLLSLFAGALLCEGGVLVGNPAASNNCFPFGCAPTSADSVYQQVYANSDFTGPIGISSIGFFNAALAGPGTFNGGTFDITLSTTTQPVNGLDTVVFANNIGADNQEFATVTLSGPAPIGEIILNGSLFNYDPTKGNLLLNITVTGPLTDHGAGNDAFFSADDGTAAGIFSRAHNFGDGFTNYGLETEFDPSSVPEPSTVLLFGVGLAVIAVTSCRSSRD